MPLFDPVHKRRLLFLLPFAPRLDATHGGGRVIAQLLTRLAPRHDIALLYLRASHEPPLDETLHQQCALVEEVQRPDHETTNAHLWAQRGHIFGSLLRGKPLWATNWAVPAYAARLRTLAHMWRPDIVQIEYHVMAQYVAALHECPAPRVLVQHEPGMHAARSLWQSQRTPGRILPLLNIVAWARFERSIMTQVHTVVVFTTRDREALASFGQPTPITHIPLGTTIPEHPLNPIGTPPPSLLFVGNFVHPPNVEAAERLGGTIFLRVQTQHPDLMLYIVGDQPPPHIQQMANTHLVVTGRVPDVTPYLDQAAVVVVPLRLGGGMRVKVLEAVAAGKAVVASPLAVQGLDLVDGTHVLLAETNQQFSDAIKRLLADPQQRAALGTRARAWACAHLGWDTSIAAYEALYEHLIERLPQ